MMMPNTPAQKALAQTLLLAADNLFSAILAQSSLPDLIPHVGSIDIQIKGLRGNMPNISVVYVDDDGQSCEVKRYVNGPIESGFDPMR